MREVVIVEAGRSAIGKRGGALARAHPIDVLGQIQMGVLERAGVASAEVGQVIGGCIGKLGAQGMNVTRNAWLAGGGELSVGCSTVDAQCGSSQHAVNLAFAAIASGQEDVVLACGVENLSRLPIGVDWAEGDTRDLGRPLSAAYLDRYEFVSQFEGAERIATKYGITRERSDEFGLTSQLRARAAIDEGRFDTQIIPVDIDVLDDSGERTGERITVSADEVPRDTSLEQLAQLTPVARPDGIHTAGTSSQIADGACAVLLMAADTAEARGATPLARIVTTVLSGCDPVLMLEGPIPATERMLQRTGLSIDDIDVFEINEAFSSIVLAWAKTVGADGERVNPNGGAIALGHPLGATGCFLTTKAVHELARDSGRYGLISMCCGGGLGTGTLVERV